MFIFDPNVYRLVLWNFYIRRGVGPVGIALGKADVNVAVGAMVAAALYGVAVPVLVIGDADRARLRSGQRVEADRDGRIRITDAESD